MKNQPAGNTCLRLIFLGAMIMLFLLACSQTNRWEAALTETVQAASLTSTPTRNGQTHTAAVIQTADEEYRQYLRSHTTTPDTLTPIPPIKTTTDQPHNTQTRTPGVQGKQPPACSFPLAQITPIESTPANYTISNPTIISTAGKQVYYTISEWLPDNQQVLMTEWHWKFVDPQESILLFNPLSGVKKIYAVRPVTDAPPIWEPYWNTVVYPVRSYMMYRGFDRSGIQISNQIWLSDGDPTEVQMLASDIPSVNFVMKSDASQILFMARNKLILVYDPYKVTASIPFDPTAWDYDPKRQSPFNVVYQLAWQPGAPLLFLYSHLDTNFGLMGMGILLFWISIPVTFVSWILEVK